MPQYFVIAFVGRTGSSYLEALLDLHTDAQCFGEIILPGAISDYSPFGVATFLDRQVHDTEQKASGFKLPLATIESPPGIFELMAAKKYKIVHITRRDKLDQYLSMRLAQENNAWRSDRGTYITQKIGIERDHLLKYVNRFYDRDRQIREMAVGLPYLHVEYEDVLANPDIPNVLDFLSLPHQRLTSKYDRQRSLSQREFIENYDEALGFLEAAGLCA